MMQFETKVTGNGRNVIITSPLYPFDMKLVESFLSEFVQSGYKVYFSTVNFKPKMTEDMKIPDVVDYYTDIIKREINAESKVYLFGFGIFTILFIDLLSRFYDKVEKLFLFEPDFYNTLLTRIFESDKNPFFKFNFLVDFYMEKNREKIRYYAKSDLKGIRNYFYQVKEYINGASFLKELGNMHQKVIIFWKIMEKESWPLPQVLLEEFSLNTYELKQNIYRTFLGPDQDIIQIFKNKMN